MEIKEINNRYSELATTDCCLSCGGAIDYSKPVPGEICADLGSGRGTDVMRLAEQVGSAGYVYGIDISEGMIAKAKETTSRLDVSNVSFLRSDLEKILLFDETIDLLISNCTLNHASDKQAVWDEIFRILKKGGRFVVSDIYAVEAIPEEFRNDPVAVAECWAGAVLRNEYMATLEKAGFANVEILEESKPYAKGKGLVASFTISGKKPGSCGCCQTS
jgi:arsenite methyltransferase